MVMTGAFGNSKPADEEIKQLLAVETVAGAITHTAGAGSIVPHAYKTQVVAGLNYLVHVTVEGVSWTVKVFKPLPHTGMGPQVTEITAGNLLA